MMKFTMDAKELKTMMEKGTAAIDKKSSLASLTRLYLQVEENGTVKVFGTDIEHYVEIRSNNAYNILEIIMHITFQIKNMNKILSIVYPILLKFLNLKSGK